MAFEGFTTEDFAVFHIQGLEERMSAIREKIQPKFKMVGESLASGLSAITGDEMYVHIARHARRKVNPPVDTWMAFSPNKRGYKQYPHFQIGLFDDRVFIWLAFIYEVANKAEIADRLSAGIGQIQRSLPCGASISFDHMKKEASPAEALSASDWEASLATFKQVKNAEILIGKQIAADQPILSNGGKFLEYTADWLRTLAPIYRIALPSCSLQL